MQTIDHNIYKLDDSLPSAAVVKPGEIFKVKVQNAFGKAFETQEEFEYFLSVANEEEKRRLNHPCAGPIEIDTEEKNISLAITILKATATKGYQCISRSTGLLKDDFKERFCEIYEFQDKTLGFKGGDVQISTSPKVGFIASFDTEVRSCGRACENGGNLDLNFLKENSTIYLPVNHSGRPRFAVGDLHICQGNGEAAGIGIEADGEVTLQVSIIDKINFPVINSENSLVVVGWGDTVEASLARGTQNTMAYLRRLFPFSSWDEGDTYRFISAEGNINIGNSTGKVKTCGITLLKKRIANKYGFPIL